MADHDQDRWTQNSKFEESANAFFGDGSRMLEVYGKKAESFDEAASKFHGADMVVPQQNFNKISMTYEEARGAASNGGY